MRLLPQTPLDWVLLAVASATALIIAVAQQDFFVDSRLGNPRIRALQDTTGPFAVIRHPIYLSYSLAWLAAPVATHGPVASLLGIGAVVIYAIAARREERLLEERFGEAYRQYRLGTGSVVPPLVRLAGRALP